MGFFDSAQDDSVGCLHTADSAQDDISDFTHQIEKIPYIFSITKKQQKNKYFELFLQKISIFLNTNKIGLVTIFLNFLLLIN